MAQQTCPTCGGRGAVSNSQTGSPELCPNCNGAGAIAVGTDDLPFWYPALSAAGAIPVLAGGQVNFAALIQITNDSDFLWDRILASSTGLYSVYLKDEFTARPLMPRQDIPIFGELIAGQAQLPFWLPKPYLLRRTSTIDLLLTDRSGAGNTIQFVLGGYKVS